MGVTFNGAQNIAAQRYTCGWCSRDVASDSGWLGENADWGRIPGAERYLYIALCPNCTMPTFVSGARQHPGVKPGEEVTHLPEDVAALYREARDSAGNGNYTSSVLLGRKLLMHIAYERGSGEQQRFIEYVNWLADSGVVTTEMKEWVDEIRQLGNDANHEIVLMERDEAEALLTFVAMLLKIVYEYPELGRRSVEARKQRGQTEAESVEPEGGGFDGGYRPPRVIG